MNKDLEDFDKMLDEVKHRHPPKKDQFTKY